MLLRSILAIAPGAFVYDFPLIPDRIADLQRFAERATLGFWMLRVLIWFNRVWLGDHAPWIIVNAWGVQDRLLETFPGEYSANPNHFLNKSVASLALEHDVIFAAGNCGQFSMSRRCGPYDRGPHRSLWGANALHPVMTVGAVRNNARWVGMSSQGPGPAALSSDGTQTNTKPDFCAPSWFRSETDARLLSTGTSAACGVAAGAVAALRQHWDSLAVPPATMKTVLRETARKHWRPDWNGRTGEGVIDLDAAVQRLEAMNLARRGDAPSV
jgi:hypothetical protein